MNSNSASPMPMIRPPKIAPGIEVKPPNIRTGSAFSAISDRLNCTPDFVKQSQVINGFSDLMVEVFGERGKHARSAVGLGSLPNQISVEIEMIVEVED